jgi:hypothetical protein
MSVTVVPGLASVDVEAAVSVAALAAPAPNPRTPAAQDKRSRCFVNLVSLTSETLPADCCFLREPGPATLDCALAIAAQRQTRQWPT